MIQKFNYPKMVERVSNGSSVAVFYKPSVKGAFSISASHSDLHSEQTVDLKMGRGSQSFAWAGASSSYSPYCKNRKEVIGKDRNKTNALCLLVIIIWSFQSRQLKPFM